MALGSKKILIQLRVFKALRAHEVHPQFGGNQ
jgi:hypothetical protein